MSGTELPTQEISDEMVRTYRRTAITCAVLHGDAPYFNDCCVRAGLAAALVASGYRREADVLREAADKIDPGPSSSRLPANNELHAIQMDCDRGVATRLRTWADVRERYGATALEQARPLLAAGSEHFGAVVHEQGDPKDGSKAEGQERSEEEEHG